ncbi:MAG: amino acid ABC transporter permease [Ruminiclostridium sp.]|jgi:polar amino acid transport system permease protein|nr:amino acid ABC transporter permease [Ruminiclostridium sp.]MCI9466079.1 amino acid ABC transporter permease [Ruminiclostridium sp.]
MSIQTMLLTLSEGFGLTLVIFFLTLVFSLPLGLLVALGRMSKFAPLKWLVQAYISIMRGTPLMLQLIAIYFGPSLLFGMSLPRNWRMTATVVAFVLNYAAYFAEIYRGGILSMPLGQYEAAEVLGYSKTRTFLTIILPQVIKSILPAVTNEIIILVKDTSLAYAIGVVEMFTAAKQICVAPNSPGLLALLAAGVFYYVFNLVVAILMERVEKRLAYYR